jgi:hypothetical protein
MEGALAPVERSFRTVKVARKRREGCAQSVPKRPNPGSWTGAGRACPRRRESRYRSHFRPLRRTSRQSNREAWGTRGPEFKSRRPD